LTNYQKDSNILGQLHSYLPITNKEIKEIMEKQKTFKEKLAELIQKKDLGGLANLSISYEEPEDQPAIVQAMVDIILTETDKTDSETKLSVYGYYLERLWDISRSFEFGIAQDLFTALRLEVQTEFILANLAKIPRCPKDAIYQLEEIFRICGDDEDTKKRFCRAYQRFKERDNNL